MDVGCTCSVGIPASGGDLGDSKIPTHVQKIIGQTGSSGFFSFDGDAAGRRAARRIDACSSQVNDSKAINFVPAGRA